MSFLCRVNPAAATPSTLVRHRTVSQEARCRAAAAARTPTRPWRSDADLGRYLHIRRVHRTTFACRLRTRSPVHGPVIICCRVGAATNRETMHGERVNAHRKKSAPFGMVGDISRLRLLCSSPRVTVSCHQHPASDITLTCFYTIPRESTYPFHKPAVFYKALADHTHAPAVRGAADTA